MNKQQTALKVRDTLRKYKEQGSDSPCRRNHIVLNAGNDWDSHERIKCEICYGLLKGRMPLHVAYISGRPNFVAFHKSEDFKTFSYITEAIDRRTGKRRDIVILETSQIIEVVNTHITDALLKEYEADDVLIIKV